MSDAPVEELGPDAMDEVVALRRAVYPDKPLDEAVLRWMYGGGPSGPARFLGIRDGGRLVALNVLLPRDLTVDGKRVPSSLIVDAMTHPEARGRGYLHALATRCRELGEAEGFVACGYPNANSERGYVRAGFAAPCRVTQWTLEWRDARRATPPPSPPPGWLALALGEGPSVDGLWPLDGRVGVYRDDAYYRWRLARPNATYRTWVAPGRGVVVAKRYGDDTVNVVELVAADLELAARGLQVALDWSLDIGARTVTAWGRAPGQVELLTRAGFARQDGPRIEILAGAVPPALHEAERWHTGQLDSDVF